MRTPRLLQFGFARESAWILAFRVTSLGAGLLVTILLTRALGASGYGIYSYAFAIVSLLSLPAQSGLPILLMRETAKNVATDRPDLVRGVWLWTGRAATAISMALLVGGVIVVLATSGGELDVRDWTLLLAFVLVPLLALGNLRGAALRGLERVLAGTMPEYLIRPIAFVIVLAVLAFTAGQYTPAEAMGIHVFAAALAFAVGAIMLWRRTPDDVRQAKPRYEARPWLLSALPLALITGMMTINGYADIIMLGIFEPDETVGIYRVAVQVSALVSLGMEAVNMVIAPRFASLYAKRDLSQLQRLASGSARVVLIASVGAGLAFLAVGRQLLDIVFGVEFVAAFVPTLILMAGGLVNSAAGSTGYLLNMTGHERDEAKVVTIAAILNLVLNLLLIPLLGAVGAAIATAVSYAVWRSWLWRYVRRRLGINSSAFAKSSEPGP